MIVNEIYTKEYVIRRTQLAASYVTLFLSQFVLLGQAFDKNNNVIWPALEIGLWGIAFQIVAFIGFATYVKLSIKNALAQNTDEIMVNEIAQLQRELKEAIEKNKIKFMVVPDQQNTSTAFPWGCHSTKLLGQLSEAAIKFWTLYDPTDPSTAPTNEQVSNWLEEQGVAKRNSEVMATILRADGLTMGRR